MRNGNSRLVIIKNAATIFAGQSLNLTHSPEPDQKTMLKSMYNNRAIKESDSL